MSIYGNPVMMGGSGGGGGGDSWLYGYVEPSSSLGSVGDLYVLVANAATGQNARITLKITKALRGASALSYAGAEEIKLIFDDGEGNEVDIRDMTGFSVTASATTSTGNPALAFDGNLATYWEAYHTPVTLTMTADIPLGYKAKRLEVYQRTGSYPNDVWSTFSLDRVDSANTIIRTLLSYENLSYTDWAGAGNWTVFPIDDPLIVSNVYVKTGASTWTPFVDWLQS